ncbi:RNA polymerase subunit sigma-70 [Phytoactinopolyspora limicola]|uniref:RNA polymerase subunit sigma-70 n=1 Tax=Phytoactinopolyspora limicola TaxID=2715536 RepID=UPI00140DBE23|nr:RNA polymerase subunit sigma-70 [Phytoactinopolyspora limicola]
MDEVVAAARAGDKQAFAAVVERYRRELLVHCYRMTGSLDDAEDLVQETFVRAWRSVGTFEGRSSLRTWLYRVATNACLDTLASAHRRRVLPYDLSAPNVPGPPSTDVAWLQPLPDRLWQPAHDGEAEPEAAVVARETIELAFLAAIQHLAPRPRAVLLLRDVLGWPAKDTAELLGLTVAAANSHLARARATLRKSVPDRHDAWEPGNPPNDDERAVLDRYMTAVGQGDLAAIAAVLAEDVQASMPPFTFWFRGRDHILAALAKSWDPSSPDYVGEFRMVPTAANGQPAAAAYVRRHDDAAYHPLAVSVLDVRGGRIREMVAFHDPALFPAFGLPDALPAG